MVEIARVLCPVDFSEASRHALDGESGGPARRVPGPDAQAPNLTARFFRRRLSWRLRRYIVRCSGRT